MRASSALMKQPSGGESLAGSGETLVASGDASPWPWGKYRKAARSSRYREGRFSVARMKMLPHAVPDAAWFEELQSLTYSEGGT